MTPDVLRSLLARVREAGGADREIDSAIVDAFGRLGPNDIPSCAGILGIGSFTSSIDAAVALVRHALPGWAWTTGWCHLTNDAWVKPDYKGPDAHLSETFDDGFMGDRYDGNVPLALIDAMLQGLIARAEHSTAPSVAAVDGERP